MTVYLEEAAEYVTEWNNRYPPGKEMISFTTWYRRRFGDKPADSELDFVKR